MAAFLRFGHYPAPAENNRRYGVHVDIICRKLAVEKNHSGYAPALLHLNRIKQSAGGHALPESDAQRMHHASDSSSYLLLTG